MHWERLDIGLDEWEQTTRSFADRTVYQSAAWLRFLAATHPGELVLAALVEGSAILGYFCGLRVRKFGVPILGSPMAGWTTQYMGFNLVDGVPRRLALKALLPFAFAELGCLHLELMDRRLRPEDGEDLEFYSTTYAGFELDLTCSEDALMAGMHDACRRNIRKAIRGGITIEERYDDGFADNYFAQLEDVFAKQNLAPTYDRERVRQLLAHLPARENLLCLEARDPEGRSIATMITVGMNDSSALWGAASWREFQILRPNQLLTWHALKHWKARGVARFDFGGAGDYKRKYGPYEISVPWLRRSRYPAFEALRGTAASLFRMRQRVMSALHRPSPPPAVSAPKAA
jgi:hypothetical protein